MGGGKAAAPDYTPVANANREAAEVAAQVQREQLAWAKEQYAMDRGVVDRVVNTYIGQMESEGAAAAQQRTRYESVFQPVEDQLVRQAQEFNTPARQEYEAGRAAQEAQAANEAARRGALAQLESFGVDPSMARSAALDAGLRVAGAGAVAGAANQARVNTEATGRAMLGEVANLGRGYPGQIASAYQTSQNAGQGAVSGTLGATQSGAGTMGTGVQWAGVNQGALGNWGSQVASMRNASTAANASMTNARNAMIGEIGGTVAGMGTKWALSDPATKKDMVRVGEDSKSGLGIWAFRYKDAKANTPKVVGVNAAEVKRLIPEAVTLLPRRRGTPLMAVDYSKLPEGVRRYITPAATARNKGGAL